MRVRAAGAGGTTVIDVAGEINIYNIARLRNALQKVLATAPSALIINLEGVRYIDSTGLGVFFGGLKKIRQHGGSITLVVTDPHLKKVFAITGVSGIFRVVATETEALGAA